MPQTEEKEFTLKRNGEPLYLLVTFEPGYSHPATRLSPPDAEDPTIHQTIDLLGAKVTLTEAEEREIIDRIWQDDADCYSDPGRTRRLPG